MIVRVVIALIFSTYVARPEIYEVTAYCSCAICCGRAGQPTASGKQPKRFRTISAPRKIPFGTVMQIEGIGVRTVEDRLSMKYDHRIDVFVGSDKNAHERAKKFGIRKLNVEIIK